MAFTCLPGPAGFITDADFYHLIHRLHFLNDSLLLAAYLPAVALVVNSKLVSPFREGWGRWGILGLGLGLAGVVIAEPGDWVSVVLPTTEALPWNFALDFRFLTGVIGLLLLVSYLYGLLAAFRGWRRSQEGLARKKSGALLLAFSVRDITWAGIYLAVVTAGFGLVDESGDAETMLLGFTIGTIGLIGYIVYVVLTGYGIATVNLLDIDLKVKWTLKRSTITAVFLAVFFVVSEGVSGVLSETVGTVVGLLSTGALLFFLAPLENLAGRFADRAMPNVQDTPEYIDFRRLEIFGEAYVSALDRGEIGVVQRAALNRLRDKLELTGDETDQLEAELSCAPKA